jgi:fructosamine-3-kinase
MSDVVERIRMELGRRGGALGLQPGRLEVAPVLNWGGFVNRSFRITDGETHFFLKLTDDPHGRRALERWRHHARRLEREYRAPAMVDWIDLEPTAFAGALFEWLDGEVPGALSPGLAAEVAGVLSRLHADETLARDLGVQGVPVGTCAGYYLNTYHDRFREDLRYVRRHRPGFVSEARLAWMRHEAEALAARVRTSRAFQGLADRPTHGDCWLHNLLLTREGAWHLLDWDDLGPGDCLVDWAMLFGPSATALRHVNPNDVSPFVPLNDALRERLAVYAQASLLDWVIDPLADWIDADRMPEITGVMREAKRDVHERAVEAYRSRFGGQRGRP